MSRTFSINGNFVVCSKFEEQYSLTKQHGVFLYNKVEEGFQKLNRFKIESLHLDSSVDFPFSVGDIIVSASNGTIVNFDGNKRWLFRPEHVLAKII